MLKNKVWQSVEQGQAMRFIPATMRNTPQWILWRLEGSKKIPYSALYYGMASTTKSSTWTTYEKALQEFQRGDYSGLGFVITKGWIFIDMDDCYENGRLTKLAENVLPKFSDGGYAEQSQSGQGLHVICKGVIPSSIKTAQIEIYGDSRYCAITGKAIFPNEPQEHQAEIDTLYSWLVSQRNKGKQERQEQLPQVCYQCSLSASEIIDKASNAKSGSVFAQLYAGNWQHLGIGDGTQSSADLSFCNKLAFWTGCDRDVMCEIFKSSGLYRNPRKMEMAVDKAIRDCGEIYRGVRR
jgi:putative DNA primase/helicase